MWIRPQEYRELGRRLAAIRARKKVTQAQLAARLKKPQSFVSAYENGQRRLDLLEFMRIAEALRVDPLGAFTEVITQAE